MHTVHVRSAWGKLAAFALALALALAIAPSGLAHPDEAQALDSTFQSFISDSRWANGTSWGEGQGPKISPWSSSGCCAYVADFAKYCFGLNSYQTSSTYTGTSAIQAGDVIWTGGHYFAVLERNGNSLTTAEGNLSGTVCVSSSRYTISGNSIVYYLKSGPQYYSVQTGWHLGAPKPSGDPMGCLDLCSSNSVGTVTVGGWAFDPDSFSATVPIHVYIGDEGHAISANTSRTDVNGVYGCGSNHGFSATFWTAKSGSQTVNVYAINAASNGGNVLLGSKTVYIQPDTTAPTISNVTVTNVDSTGYTVKCNVKDNVGVSSVKFPSWNCTSYTGSDANWITGTVSNGVATARIPFSSLKGGYVPSAAYMTHVYAYDSAGNRSNTAIPQEVTVDSAGPTISDVAVGTPSASGFDVSLKADDASGVSEVYFKVSYVKSAAEGEDESAAPSAVVETEKLSATLSNGVWTAHVSPRYNNGSDRTYSLVAYAVDKVGNRSSYSKAPLSAIAVPADNGAPVIENVTSSFDEESRVMTVECDVYDPSGDEVAVGCNPLSGGSSSAFINASLSAPVDWATVTCDGDHWVFAIDYAKAEALYGDGLEARCPPTTGWAGFRLHANDAAGNITRASNAKVAFLGGDITYIKVGETIDCPCGVSRPSAWLHIVAVDAIAAKRQENTITASSIGWSGVLLQSITGGTTYKYVPTLIAYDDITSDRCEVSLSADSVDEQDGYAERPSVTVAYDGTALEEGVAYEVAYEADSDDPNKVNVTVTGIKDGGLEGSVTLSYTVNRPQVEPGEGEEVPAVLEVEVSKANDGSDGSIQMRDSSGEIVSTVAIPRVSEVQAESDCSGTVFVRVLDKDGNPIPAGWYTYEEDGDSVEVTLSPDYYDSDVLTATIERNSEHAYEVSGFEPATLDADGYVLASCRTCGRQKSVSRISAIEGAELSKATYTYTGKACKPAVTVTASNGKEISSDNYAVKYSSNAAVGQAKVTITFDGQMYKGTITKAFKIVPAKGTLYAPASKSAGTLTVKAGKAPAGYGGAYLQVAYKQVGTSKWVTKKCSTQSVKLTKLKKGKQYYVRVRAYKTVGGKTYTGAWSATKKSGKVK